MATWVKTINGLPEIVDQMFDRVITIPDGAKQIMKILTDNDVPRDLVEEFDLLDGGSTFEDFDLAMEQLYDWADEARVWIDPVT